MTDTPPHGKSRSAWRTWFAGIAIVLLLLIAAAVSLYWIWGNRASTRLAAAREALRQAGEPLTAAELAQAPVPPERNAALLLREAARRIDDEDEMWQAMNNIDWPIHGSRLPMTEEERAIIQRAVERCSQVFPIVERAAQLDGVDWQIDYTAGLVNLDLKDLNEQRELANLLQFAALLAHEQGDDARAVELAQQIGFIADAVGTQPTLVSSLVAVGMQAMRVSLLADIAPAMKISDSDPRAVPPDTLRHIIEELLDDPPKRRALRIGLRGDRALQQDILQAMAEGRLSAPGPGGAPAGSPWGGMLLGPMISENALVLLEQTTAMMNALDEPDLPSYRARVPLEQPQIRESPRRFLLAGILLPSLARTADTSYRLVNDSHVAAAALAIRWFAVDHDGRLPASLDELVPKYLPHVPRDVLIGGDKPIGYINDPDRPRLYHVGENRTDDGGREPDPDATARANRERSDEVVHLKRPPRPATRPAHGE